ncbi:unnamed protein product [Staurois parvus]|uniref:Uncharacterized protein n=1 Tax=Staurois parvus TaxID=386267 RepID=A0ABN9CT22_9NEOB|nr:unnamed protein product [Staurois parvus]
MSRRSQGTEPRKQMPASARGHCRGHCRRDIAGAQDTVSDRGIPEQRRIVSPSVACGTETLPRATLGNTAREVTFLGVPFILFFESAKFHAALHHSQSASNFSLFN